MFRDNVIDLSSKRELKRKRQGLMKLRCSNCSKEKYEDEMVLDKETGHSKCECGCSTFTVLCNMEEIQ